MINLLPKEERKAIRNLYRMRVAVVLLLFVIALEVCAAILFSPAFYNLYLTKNELAQTLEMKRQAIPKDVEELQARITKLKEMVELLKNKGDTTATSLIDEIQKQKGGGVSIVGYTYDLQSKTIQLRGKSATREDLTQFRKRMRDLGKYQSVDVPPSTLLKEKDIDFTMRMMLNK